MSENDFVTGFNVGPIPDAPPDLAAIRAHHASAEDHPIGCTCSIHATTELHGPEAHAHRGALLAALDALGDAFEALEIDHDHIAKAHRDALHALARLDAVTVEEVAEVIARRHLLSEQAAAVLALIAARRAGP